MKSITAGDTVSSSWDYQDTIRKDMVIENILNDADTDLVEHQIQQVESNEAENFRQIDDDEDDDEARNKDELEAAREAMSVSPLRTTLGVPAGHDGQSPHHHEFESSETSFARSVSCSPSDHLISSHLPSALRRPSPPSSPTLQTASSRKMNPLDPDRDAISQLRTEELPESADGYAPQSLIHTNEHRVFYCLQTHLLMRFIFVGKLTYSQAG